MSEKHFDGMAWPVPDEEMAELEYSLRYGESPNVTAASVIAAYRRILCLPQREREIIVKKLTGARP